MTWMEFSLIRRRLYCHFGWKPAVRPGYDWKMEHSLMLRSMAPEFAEPMMKEIFGQDFDYHGVRNRRKALMNAYMETHPVEIKPGAEELLRYLKSHYFKTGGCNSQWRDQGDDVSG